MHSTPMSGFYRILVWYGAFALLALIMTACGGKESPADLCDEVFCLFGVCDSSTGACANVEVCEKADDCLAGYECADTGACEPLFSCVGL